MLPRIVLGNTEDPGTGILELLGERGEVLSLAGAA
jgi:hypothetical protein